MACMIEPSSGAGAGLTRVYLISFASVWDAVLDHIASKRRWELVQADEEVGEIWATRATGLRGKNKNDVRVRVSLDHNGLTQVTATATATMKPRPEHSARLVKTFLANLDRRVSA